MEQQLLDVDDGTFLINNARATLLRTLLWQSMLLPLHSSMVDKTPSSCHFQAHATVDSCFSVVMKNMFFMHFKKHKHAQCKPLPSTFSIR